MTRKILSFMVVGVFCVALSGLAAAEAPVLIFPEEISLQPAVDPPEWNLTDDASPRDPVETGAVPEMESGYPIESHSLDRMGPAVEFGGVTYHYNTDTP